LLNVYFHIGNMIFSQKKYRIIASAFLLILVTMFIAIQVPWVQTTMVRALILPRIEKTLAIDLSLTHCHFDLWSQKMTVQSLQARDDESMLFKSERVTIQWDQSSDDWGRIDSVLLQGLKIELLRGKAWFSAMQRKRKNDSNNAQKTNGAIDFNVACFSIQNLEGTISSETAFHIDKAVFNGMDYRNESITLPLDSCTGTAFIPVTGNPKESIKIDVRSLVTSVQSNNSTWSLDTLSAVTSAFEASFSNSGKANEWRVHAHLNDSIEIDPLAFDPRVRNWLDSITKSTGSPELNGRLWMDTLTQSVECAFVISGIAGLRNVSDSIKVRRDSLGFWKSTGTIALDWNHVNTNLAAILGNQLPQIVHTWGKQKLSSTLTWEIEPLKQRLSLDLPMPGNSLVNWKILCSEPWTPTSFNGTMQNMHFPQLPFSGKAWFVDVGGKFEDQRNTLQLTLRNDAEALFTLNALDIPQHDSGERRIDAHWTSETLDLPMSGDLSFGFNDSLWHFKSDVELNGIHALGLSEGKDWSLFANLELRASGNQSNEWTGILESRNINLLENSRPIAFDRFDAILEHKNQMIDLQWHSDLSNGRLSASDDMESWKRWINRVTGDKANDQAVPFVEFEASLLRFRPLELIFGTPFSLSPNAIFTARTESSQLALSAEIPTVYLRESAGHALDLKWNFDDSTSTMQMHMDSITSASNRYASDVVGIVELGNEWEGSISWDEGSQSKSAQIGFLSTPPFRSEGRLKITKFHWPILGQSLELVQPECLLHWNSIESEVAAAMPKPVTLQSKNWTLQAMAFQRPGSNWFADIGFAVDESSESMTKLMSPASIDSLNGRLTATINGINSEVNFNVSAEKIDWKGERISNLRVSGNGWKNKCGFDIQGNWGDGLLDGNGEFGFGSAPFLVADWKLEGIEVAGIKQLIPENTLNLSGEINGELESHWKSGELEISGTIQTDSLRTFVPALGTDYSIAADVQIDPGFIQINQGKITDRNGSNAMLNGTAYHKGFKEWDLDFGIDASSSPIELMNLLPKQASYYYGTGIGTGDINIAGFGTELLIEANIAAKKGTDFALPLDAVSDASYAQFIQFQTNESVATAAVQEGTFSNVTLAIGLDVEPEATARIVFNQSTGEEILGKTKGHLDLRVDDFEDINLKGSLEVTEGTYYFTLQNLINKTFNIVPGGTIEWYGDPYAAQIDLLTSYETRARLDPILPDEPNLPGRVPVELLLSLNGALFQPEIGFNIKVPKADSRLEILIEGALLNEEELQRQALSLLVMNQFISQDPLTSALGGFQGAGHSSAFLANQLGHWISQISPGMDLGLDYSNDDLSGEQELALALSTQLFNERLRLEGAFGAQSAGQISTDDIQVQDVTISYDLDRRGQYQVTGQSKSNQSMINALDGSSTQGVGIRMRHEFNRWGDWKIEKSSAEID